MDKPKKEDSFHVCDSPERIAQCLNCTQPVCYGGCPALRALPPNVRKIRKKEPVPPDESVYAVVRWIRAGATDRFIMRELCITEKELKQKRKIALRAGLIY